MAELQHITILGVNTEGYDIYRTELSNISYIIEDNKNKAEINKYVFNNLIFLALQTDNYEDYSVDLTNLPDKVTFEELDKYSEDLNLIMPEEDTLTTLGLLQKYKDKDEVTIKLWNALTEQVTTFNIVLSSLNTYEGEEI